MRRYLVLGWVILLAAFISPVAIFANDPSTSDQQHYIVRGLGVKLGTFTLASQRSGGTYGVRSRFTSTGAMALLARVHFEMQATGRWTSAGPQPAWFLESVDTGRRQSTAHLDYASGVPRVTGGRLGSDTPPLRPEHQRDTVDPATAIFDPATAIFRAVAPQAPDDLCALDQPIFDGARRTRLVLDPPRPKGAGFVCWSTLQREDGYSARELARAKSFDLELSYEAGPDGRFHMSTAKVATVFGTVTLQGGLTQAGR
ncbi:DUF3108 domain-containing protein [Epibacterium sp. Ofav1-8]|uniref:DUF3108 domain-containing protein n=1 Tax=Epibacterium sp. Ofav1-8 TaxID=2917735 RepID=UPI001EF5257C|nr:DUF3108 domain-containing protein [Epibacterium sp. Ofav1-8]MCG7622930.1 DUF3108 domain-containing protein [Epibacterium sp. Ofav1-8]